MSDLGRYSFLEDSHNDCYCDMIPDSKGNWVDAEAAHKRIAELEAKNTAMMLVATDRASTITQQRSAINQLQAKNKRLEEQNKRMVGLLKEVRLTKDYQWLYSEYGEFEWIGDRDEVLASMEPRKLTGYESEALINE